MDVEVSLAVGTSPRVAPLVRGEVDVPGYRLDVSTQLHGPKLFRHQLETRQFDVSEMSLTTVFSLAARGDDSFVALPIFPMREVFHANAVVASASAPLHPSELAGRLVALPNFWSAAAIWARGALQDDFDLNTGSVQWLATNPGAPGEAAVGALTAERLPTTAEEALAQGRVAAALNLGRQAHVLVDAGIADWLFVDCAAERRRYVAKHGFVPMNHCIVVTREVAGKHPELPGVIYRAFLDAAEAAACADTLGPSPGVAASDESLLQGAERDGLVAQRLALATFGRYCHEQGALSCALQPEEVFPDFAQPCVAEGRSE